MVTGKLAQVPARQRLQGDRKLAENLLLVSACRLSQSAGAEGGLGLPGGGMIAAVSRGAGV